MDEGLLGQRRGLEQLAEAVGNRPVARRSLVDVHGLGKPPAFTNDDKQFDEALLVQMSTPG